MGLNMDNYDMVFKGLGIIVLILVILFIATWGGIVKCGSIPYFCDVYDYVLGSPRIAIIHGDEGLGNPEKLREVLLSPDQINAKAVDLMHIDRVSAGNLKNYRLVIVEKARVLSFDHLQMFKEFVEKGGRLIWIGDAGVDKSSDELQDLTDMNSLKTLATNPWVRFKETETEYLQLNFDEVLGLKYVGNYCDEVICTSAPFTVGVLKTEPTGNHPLIFGLSAALNLKISNDKDFAVVKQFPNSSNSNIVLTLDFKGNINGKSGSLGKSLPLIATSGTGERVAYYAYPPEYFIEDNNYWNVVKRMYYGMLGK